MKHSIKTLLDSVISDSRDHIILNGGNVAIYLIDQAYSIENGFYFFWTDEEISLFEKGTSFTRASMKAVVIEFIFQNYNYNLSEPTFSLIPFGLKRFKLFKTKDGDHHAQHISNFYGTGKNDPIMLADVGSYIRLWLDSYTDIPEEETQQLFKDFDGSFSYDVWNFVLSEG